MNVLICSPKPDLYDKLVAPMASIGGLTHATNLFEAEAAISTRRIHTVILDKNKEEYTVKRVFNNGWFIKSTIAQEDIFKKIIQYNNYES